MTSEALRARSLARAERQLLTLNEQLAVVGKDAGDMADLATAIYTPVSDCADPEDRNLPVTITMPVGAWDAVLTAIALAGNMLSAHAADRRLRA